MKLVILKRTPLLLLLFLFTSPEMEISESAPIPGTPESRVVHLQHRLEEIKTIDKKTLSNDDKKALRREVREIKKELAAISGGVYLSIGAIILIALLLILLL